MDLRKIKKLIELLEESGIAEIEIREGEESVRISRVFPSVGPATATVMPAPVVVPATAASHAPPVAAAAPIIMSKAEMEYAAHKKESVDVESALALLDARLSRSTLFAETNPHVGCAPRWLCWEIEETQRPEP